MKLFLLMVLALTAVSSSSLGQGFDAQDPKFIGQIRAAAWDALSEADAPAKALLERRFRALETRYPGINFVDYKDGVHRLIWTNMQANVAGRHCLPSLAEIEGLIDRADAVEIKYYKPPLSGTACKTLGAKFAVSPAAP